MKTILITGGSGFIGSNLVNYFLKNNYKVINIDIKESNFINKNNNYEFIKLDISKKENFNLLKNKKIDIVFHLAADPNVKNSINPNNCFKSNIIGTFNLLEFIRTNNIKELIFTSTSTVYEINNKELNEKDLLKPISNYGASKAAMEMFMYSYNSSYNIKITIVRLANIYGPPSDHGVMKDFYFKLKKNPNELLILGDGLQKKSYLYIDDCINGIISAWKNTKNIEIFNIGHDEWNTVNEIAKEISSYLNINPNFKYSGSKIGWIGDIAKIKLDISKIKKTNWKPIISLKTGIKKYISWLENNYSN